MLALQALALHDGLYAFEVGDEAGMAYTTAATSLTRLVRRGLVEREHEPRTGGGWGPRRAPWVVWRLTRAGLRLMRAWFRFLEDSGVEMREQDTLGPLRGFNAPAGRARRSGRQATHRGKAA